MKIRRRTYRSGKQGWQLDCGMINGQRVQIACGNEEEAKQTLAIASEIYRHLGNVGVAEWVERRAAGLVDLPMIVQPSWYEDALSAVRLLDGRTTLTEAAGALMQEWLHRDLPTELVSETQRIVPVGFPTGSGVYFLTLSSRIVYIGQSRNVMARVAQHFNDGFYQFDFAWWQACPTEELNKLERAWIQRLMPDKNILWKTPSGHAR
jgi:GIY-YIG catalytic domain